MRAGCSLGLQEKTYGIINDMHNLPNQPMEGTLGECLAACAATGNCVAFSWKIGVTESTTDHCYLKTVLTPKPSRSTSRTWTTYIIRCKQGAM